MLRIASLTLAMTIFASCERSSRNIDVAPVNPSIKPDNTTGGDTLSKSGDLAIQVSGFPSTVSSADLMISIDGDLESRTVNLTAGKGTTTVNGLPVGPATVKITAIVNQTAYFGSSTVTIKLSSQVATSMVMSANTNPNPPSNPTPSGGGTDTSVDIGIDIGGTTPTQPPTNSDPSNPSGNTPSPSPTNLWDGKSFKGNSMFNIEPVK